MKNWQWVCLVYRCTWWTTPGLFWPSGKVSGLCTGWWVECTSAGHTAQGGPGGCCQHLIDNKRGEIKWLWNKIISTDFSVEPEGLSRSSEKAVGSNVSLPGRCWTTGMSSFFRSSAFPTPDSISSWGELMAPPLSITSLSANTWGPDQWNSMGNTLDLQCFRRLQQHEHCSFLPVWFGPSACTPLRQPACRQRQSLWSCSAPPPSGWDEAAQASGRRWPCSTSSLSNKTEGGDIVGEAANFAGVFTSNRFYYVLWKHDCLTIN